VPSDNKVYGVLGIMIEHKTLCVVSCGKSKVWDKKPDVRYVEAGDAYTGSFFKCNREYANKFHENNWIILSAKYGFIKPTTLIENYNARFKNSSLPTDKINMLLEQAKPLVAGYDNYFGWKSLFFDL
jgi:hypothetical protein